MTIVVGARLGAYEILAALGAGGMGEVYRAKDTKVGGDVALKILPASFTDNDRKFTEVDAVFEAHGTRIVRTPIQSPEGNGVAERFVRAARSECLDWLLIVNAQHLERTVKVFIDHYNGSRHHRSLELVPGWPAVTGHVGRDATDRGQTSRPFGRTHSRMRAYGVSRIEFLHRTGSLRGHKRPPDADDYCLALA